MNVILHFENLTPGMAAKLATRYRANVNVMQKTTREHFGHDTRHNSWGKPNYALGVKSK